ncbi:MAG: hypothetical protein IKG27_01275 [Bacilli bacterium]|nr:hypothetical protein [Bacilli bacterium]
MSSDIKTFYMISLYDYYGDLLTDKQKEYFEDYYFKNYSLSEISENKNVSRTAIHKVIKESEKKLTDYEKKLQNYEKASKIKKIIENIDEETRKKIEELI